MTDSTNPESSKHVYPFSDVKFTQSEWDAIQRAMDVADSTMRQIAQKYGLRFSSDGKYPGKRLRKRQGIVTRQISLALMSDENNRDERRFELIGSAWTSIWILHYRSLGYVKFSEYSERDVQSPDRLRADIENAVRDMSHWPLHTGAA